MLRIPSVRHNGTSASGRARRRRKPSVSGRYQRTLMLEGLEERTLLAATVYTVTDLADTISDTGSLRYAIAQANANPNSDGIEIQFGSLFSTPQTITLGGSQLKLTNTHGATITGPAAGVTIDGAGLSRVFQI